VTELEKMLAGGLYDFSDAELAEQFREGRRRVERFNRTPVDDNEADAFWLYQYFISKYRIN